MLKRCPTTLLKGMPSHMHVRVYRQFVSKGSRVAPARPSTNQRGKLPRAVAAYALGLTAWALSFWAVLWIFQRILPGNRTAMWGISLGLMALAGGLVLARVWAQPNWAKRGLALERGQAPELFKLIDAVRASASGPRLHGVLLNTEMNASMVQRARLGLLGWHHNTLVLGLPLMMCLDQRQLASVLAHEWGHLCATHGKLGGWLYRTRRNWSRLAELRGRAPGGLGERLLAACLRQYFPRFNARVALQSRQQEFAADAAAHGFAGRTASAQTLVTVNLAARYLEEEFWPRVFMRARQRSEPEGSPMADLRTLLARVGELPQAAQWLREACKRAPCLHDSHPSLSQRLRFAQHKPELPRRLRVSAAQALLGENLPKMVAALDSRWRADQAEQWKDLAQWYQQWSQLRHALMHLSAKQPLDADEIMLLWRCVRHLEEPKARLRWLQTHVQTYPGHPGLRYALGHELLSSPMASDKARGLAHLQRIAAGDSAWALPAAEAVLGHSERTESGVALRRARAQVRVLKRHEDRVHRAQRNFNGSIVLRPARYSTLVLQPLLDLLQQERVVAAAYLLNKPLAFAGRPFCVLVVQRDPSARPQPDARTYWMQLKERIYLPGEFMVVDSAHPAWAQGRAAVSLQQMMAVPGACIYRA